MVLEATAIFMVFIPIMTYRTGGYPKRARRAVRPLLYVTLPIGFLLIQLIALSVLLAE